MTNLEWLKKVKEADGDVDEAIKKAKGALFADEEAIGKIILEYRKIKALEIIAEELTKINLTFDVLNAVIEGVTNQGRSVNVDARVSINK